MRKFVDPALARMMLRKLSNEALTISHRLCGKPTIAKLLTDQVESEAQQWLQCLPKLEEPFYRLPSHT